MQCCIGFLVVLNIRCPLLQPRTGATTSPSSSYNTSAILAANASVTRLDSRLYKVNPSGVYSFLLYNSGGQAQETDERMGRMTTIGYSYGAYAASETGVYTLDSQIRA